MIFAGVLWLLGTECIWAQIVRQEGEDRVSILAEGTALGDLLRELASMAPIEKLLIDASVERKSVRVELQNVSYSEALSGILEAAQVNYVIQGGEGEPFSVYAGSPTDPKVPADQLDEDYESEQETTVPSPDPSLPPGEEAPETVPFRRESQPRDRATGQISPRKREVTGDAHLVSQPGPWSRVVLVGLLGTGFLVGCLLTAPARPRC